MPIFAKQVLNRAQSEFKKTEKAKHPDLKTTHLKADSNGNLKGAFKKLIGDLQLAKYPHPPFTCQQQSIEVEGKKIPVTYIKAEGQINLSREQLHQVSVNSLLLRKVALAATLEAYATQHVTGKNQLKTIRNQIEHLVNESIHEAIKQAENPKQKVNTYGETNEFINKLGIILNNNTQLKNHNEAVRVIKAYERYVLSEMNAGKVIINESTLVTNQGKKNILQMDIPLDAQLTKDQKKEYLRILTSKKPEWFQKLPPEEQHWYQDRVKRAQESHDGWTKFAQEIYGTSAMQQALELKNARKNYFFINGELQSESTKNATLNAIEVPKKERQQVTRQNAEQLIENQIQGAEEHFKEHWGLSPNAKLPCKIMLASQSLLSPLLGLADDKMIKAQKEAIEYLANDPRYKDKYQIVFGNDAVNIFRKFQTIDWKYTNEVMDYAKALKANLQEVGVDSNHTQMKIMSEALVQLEALKRAPDLSDRNKAVFKTVLTSILIEASGGKVSTNCKSGTDRTGLEELYHNAILTYYNLYNEFPRYDDGSEKRQQFVNVFSHLFNTLKIHESASWNTIGAFGIKDSAKMLCSDIAKALGANYTMSNSRANINKTEEAFIKKITKKFDQDKAALEVDVFTDFALAKLEHRKHELEQKSDKKEKISALDQLIVNIKNGQDLISTLNEFLTNEKNKRIFSSKLGVSQDLTTKLIKRIIKEYEDNNKLIEEKNQYQKREQEVHNDTKKVPERDSKRQQQHEKSSIAQHKGRLEHDKSQLLQFKTELAKVKEDLEKNKQQLAQIQAELVIQKNELDAVSTTLSNEKKITRQKDIKLTQEIELLEHLNTALEIQKNELQQLKRELKQISSMPDQLNVKERTLEQLMTEHQKENHKLEFLTQLQNEKSTLDELTQEHNKETKKLKSDESVLKTQQEQKQFLETKKSEMVKELKNIQEEEVQKETNKWFITKVLAAITSFFKSIFSSSAKEIENNIATQKTKEIKQLESKIEQLSNGLEQQERIVQEQQNKVNNLEKSIEEQTRIVKDIGNLNKEIKAQTEKVEQLKTEIMQAEEEIAQLKKVDADSHMKIQELTEDIRHQKEVISDTHVMLNEKGLAITELQENLSVRLNVIEEMGHQIDDKRQSIEEKKRSMTTCKDAIQNNGTAQRHLQNKITKQEKKIQQQEVQPRDHIERSMSIKQKLQESKAQENNEQQVNQISVR